jgi:molecular chaperone HtpG
VVDSADLSLNVSRELLQQDRQITQIRRGLVKKVLATLAEMKEKDTEGYLAFWSAFGRALKEGTGDAKDKDQLIPLLLFSSSTADDLVSLSDYVGHMKDDQEEIYYITGESMEVVRSSPHLEAFKDRGYEVLFLTDTVDELMVQAVTEFEGKKLRSIGKGTVELGTKEEREEAEKARKGSEEGYAALLKMLQQKLDEQVKEVRLSSRLTSSPVCLVTGEHDMSPQLEKLMKQARGETGPMQKRILELNPDHPILASLKARFEADADDSLLGDYAELLLGQALLAEGTELADPARFSGLVAELMVRAG